MTDICVQNYWRDAKLIAFPFLEKDEQLDSSLSSIPHYYHSSVQKKTTKKPCWWHKTCSMCGPTVSLMDNINGMCIRLAYSYSASAHFKFVVDTNLSTEALRIDVKSLQSISSSSQKKVIYSWHRTSTHGADQLPNTSTHVGFSPFVNVFCMRNVLHLCPLSPDKMISFHFTFFPNPHFFEQLFLLQWHFPVFCLFQGRSISRVLSLL